MSVARRMSRSQRGILYGTNRSRSQHSLVGGRLAPRPGPCVIFGMEPPQGLPGQEFPHRAIAVGITATMPPRVASGKGRKPSGGFQSGGFNWYHKCGRLWPHPSPRSRAARDNAAYQRSMGSSPKEVPRNVGLSVPPHLHQPRAAHRSVACRLPKVRTCCSRARIPGGRIGDRRSASRCA